MMKRFLALILALMLVLSACGDKSKPTEPTDGTGYEDPGPDQPIEDPIMPTVPLSEHSDLALITKTLISAVCAEAYSGSFIYGSQEWVIYMMEQCEPFKELMFRETALESLSHYVPSLIAFYQETYPKNVYGLTSLCAYLIPEYKLFFDCVGYSYSGAVVYEVCEEVQAAYMAYLDSLKSPTSQQAMELMHFEDDVAAQAFAEAYLPATAAIVLNWDVANEDDSNPLIYVMTAFVCTEQAPEGEFLTQFVAKMDGQYRIMTDITQVPADLRKAVRIPDYLPFDWYGFTDHELMEQTILGDAIGSLIYSSVSYEGDALVEYMSENCSAFRALLERDTGLDSLREGAVALVEAHRDEWGAPFFARLALALFPELEGAGEEFVTSQEIDWVISEAYHNFLRAAMGGQAPLRYMHFEDADAEAEFAENFSTYTEASATWTCLSEYLYVFEMFICTEQDPVGVNATYFLGRIDDCWLVMVSVDQIPEALKADLDLSKYA